MASVALSARLAVTLRDAARAKVAARALAPANVALSARAAVTDQLAAAALRTRVAAWLLALASVALSARLAVTLRDCAAKVALRLVAARAIVAASVRCAACLVFFPAWNVAAYCAVAVASVGRQRKALPTPDRRLLSSRAWRGMERSAACRAQRLRRSSSGRAWR